MHDTFLCDILENPADDAARLVYADWLREHGYEARGEFIWVQVELHNKPCDRWMYGCHELGYGRCKCPDTGRYMQLREREQELLALHGDEWLRGDYGTVLHAHPHGGVEYRRGFPWRVSITHTAFTRSCARIFRWLPVEHVHLHDRAPMPNTGPRCTWGHGFNDTDLAASSWLLPAPVFRKLSLFQEGYLTCTYSSKDLALSAASAACVAHGKEKSRGK